MSDPINQAAAAILDACCGQELPEAPIDLARAAFESINRDRLATMPSGHIDKFEDATRGDLGCDECGVLSGSWAQHLADEILEYLTPSPPIETQTVKVEVEERITYEVTVTVPVTATEQEIRTAALGLVNDDAIVQCEYTEFTISETSEPSGSESLISLHGFETSKQVRYAGETCSRDVSQ